MFWECRAAAPAPIYGVPILPSTSHGGVKNAFAPGRFTRQEQQFGGERG
jgi:hypothetical protein